MTNEAFEVIVENRIDKIRLVLTMKAKEYATSADRLHNFKHAASILRQSPAESCIAFLTKHVVSIYDMVFNVKYGNPPPKPATIDEKIGDAINYLILLEAILLETPKK